MHRRLLTGLLLVFLLLMQQESLRHPIEHVGAQLQRIEHSMLERPGGTCAECDLLSGSAGSVHSTPATLIAPAPAGVAIFRAVDEPASTFLSYYRSRAPPFAPRNV